ncbi:Peptidase M20 domain-containing protein 2 [Fusarium sp. LHS14.1]|nr:Peptidase M20 domain-containing protein 2 [Fusarium sp. LHS14.1]
MPSFTQNLMGASLGGKGSDLPSAEVKAAIDACASDLRLISTTIHDNPELGYKEFTAHKVITDFLEKQGFTVTRHAYGLETSFEAEYGSGGRLVVFCAEIDALPEIGHACGHNLIATSSIAGFIGLVGAIKASPIKGRVRILGTPAEEGGAGKVKLLEAGAFNNVDSAIMMHPTSDHSFPQGFRALAGVKFIASMKLRVEFRGHTAHAGGEPWKGLNALDAAVSSYTNISMLRQQMRPDERIHGVIEDGGTVPNVIPEYSRMNYYIRSPTIKGARELLGRVKNCFEAAAKATGCEVNYIEVPAYTELRINNTLSYEFSKIMGTLGEKVIPRSDEPFTFSTDMGNVSFAVPSFHGAFGIPAPLDAMPHQAKFAEVSDTEAAVDIALSCAHGMALLGWRVLTDDEFAAGARKDFNTPDYPDQEICAR